MTQPVAMSMIISIGMYVLPALNGVLCQAHRGAGQVHEVVLLSRCS